LDIDIRDQETISHSDILHLNFIRSPSPFFFRKHFQEGLRSRLLQVLRPADVALETTGVLCDGIRHFPLARPVFVLRIFKERFNSVKAVEAETQRFRMVQKFLPKTLYAGSQEMIVSYFVAGSHEILLCGLQEFVPGEILDPWGEDLGPHLKSYFESATEKPKRVAQLLNALKLNALSFVGHVKAMARDAGLIPDLAGVGNLRITAKGDLKLVDINNISKIHLDDRIHLDDKGYPVCDKSIQALANIEACFSGHRVQADDALYRLFLNADRMTAVEAHVRRFHETTSARGNYPKRLADDATHPL
jgi:hypothetical protein